MIREHLAHIAYLDEAIGRLSREIGERLRPFDETRERPQPIRGVGGRLAEVLLAEVGNDVCRFPTHRHPRLGGSGLFCLSGHNPAG